MSAVTELAPGDTLRPRQDEMRIAVFASFSGAGGVERMVANLCRGFADAGHPVDLVLVRADSVHLGGLPPQVRVVRLGTRHTLGSLFALAAYLRRERPAALLAAKDRAGQTAVLARWLACVPVRLVFRIGTTVSAALEGRSLLAKLLWYLPMRLLYRYADAIVAVSQGVAADLQQITGLPERRFRVIANPVVTPELKSRAQEPDTHPWLDDPRTPVVLGIGRLTRQKDFPTLLKAFARVAAVRDCRLVILGEGRDRSALEALARELGIAERVALPGFCANPYAWLSRSRLFVLSSAWEGSPNALTEAMALGVPVVATDCPSGPREILDGGRVAPLVAVGDVAALAAAMRRTLDEPPEPEELRRAVADYTLEASSRRYLDALLGATTG
jgi:glycosyltransferase involved in cell wall biosynthesis